MILVRFLIVPLTAGMLMFAGASAQTDQATDQDTCYASFDINGDGTVLTVGDLVYLMRAWYMGYPPVDQWYMADLNGDCVIDAYDLEMLECFFLYGIAPCFPEWPVPTCCDPDTVVGACCLGDSCSMRSEAHWAELGGAYRGDNTSCWPVNPCACCRGLAGNVDLDPDDDINIADVTFLAEFLFVCGFSRCIDEENVDGLLGPGDIPTDIADLTYLVEYLFVGGPAPPPCQTTVPFEYRGYDSDDSLIVTGWLLFESIDENGGEGHWYLKPTGDTVGYGPQFGSDAFMAEFIADTWTNNLNLNYADNNVVLIGDYDGTTIDGTWEWLGFPGVMNSGRFEAIRTY